MCHKNKTKIMNARKGLIRKRGGDRAGREVPECGLRVTRVHHIHT